MTTGLVRFVEIAKSVSNNVLCYKKNSSESCRYVRDYEATNDVGTLGVLFCI